MYDNICMLANNLQIALYFQKKTAIIFCKNKCITDHMRSVDKVSRDTGSYKSMNMTICAC